MCVRVRLRVFAYIHTLSDPLSPLRQDGWRGLQRGVAATAMYQVAMNVVRLGTYDAVRDALARTLDSVSPPSSASSSSVRGVAVATLAGMATGAAGASLSLPFFMLKVRSQGLSAHYGDSVGGVLGELRRVARADGFGALYRGGRIAVTRTSLASGAQFFGYEAVRRLVCERLGWKHDLRTRVVASFGASIMATAVLNPLDLVYAHVVTNSPVAQQVAAAAHSGRATLLPVAAALVRANGVRVLGRGFTAGYLRSGPNTIITFVVWQQLRALFE